VVNGYDWIETETAKEGDKTALAWTQCEKSQGPKKPKKLKRRFFPSHLRSPL
jgi:hypothetical protein